ncbi:MAG: gamma-glutamyl-gamma-aminobutyrate hydrolase family protein [Gemmataceae bacterium]|nr:gamma-glutamyl-gamma-aminobutyrate hydrolase family protein [Gemmataceae bacterium]
MAQCARPVVGLNMDVVLASKTTRPHLRLHLGFLDAVLTAGGLPVPMPPYGKKAEIEKYLEGVDGFILTGGLDMDPRRQGLPMHRSVQPMPERREDSDRVLVALLVERRLPVLGIGVGMHQLNVASGGTLIQHLPEELPRAMPHFDPSCTGPHRHAVLLQPSSRLDEIYGEGEIRVNSSHHQAVKTVGALFRVAAQAPDGVIEAIEAVDPHWFGVGVQWHPESETASALDLQLFECFVQACTRQSQPVLMAA